MPSLNISKVGRVCVTDGNSLIVVEPSE